MTGDLRDRNRISRIGAGPRPGPQEFKTREIAWHT